MFSKELLKDYKVDAVTNNYILLDGLLNTPHNMAMMLSVGLLENKHNNYSPLILLRNNQYNHEIIPILKTLNFNFLFWEDMKVGFLNEQQAKLISIILSLFPRECWRKLKYKKIGVGGIAIDTILRNKKLPITTDSITRDTFQKHCFKSIINISLTRSLKNSFKLRKAYFSHKCYVDWAPIYQCLYFEGIKVNLFLRFYVWNCGDIANLNLPYPKITTKELSEFNDDDIEIFFETLIAGNVEQHDMKLAHNRSESKKNSKILYNKENIPTILFASHAFSDWNHWGTMLFKDYYDSLLKTYKLFEPLILEKKVKLLIRLHPSRHFYGEENMDESLKVKMKYAFFLDDNLTTDEAIKLCDVVITVRGTIALESTALGKKCFLLGETYFDHLGIGERIFKKSNLVSRIIEFLNEPQIVSEPQQLIAKRLLFWIINVRKKRGKLISDERPPYLPKDERILHDTAVVNSFNNALKSKSLFDDEYIQELCEHIILSND